PNWNTANFFADALVTFYVPGSPSLTGSNFQAAPCNNVIPTYTNGFWMNVTTNVALIAANVTIWGTSWPSPGNAAPDIPNFGQEAPVRVLPMNILGPYYHTATFWFDVYRFFWPGSQVYFNVTLESVGATPPTIRSTESAYSVPVTFPGGVNNATWEFYVGDPWGAGQFQQSDSNFSQVIQVTTTPSVLTSPAFDPNPRQTLDVTLTSVNPSGGPATPIPEALASFTVTGGQVGAANFEIQFAPANHTVMHLQIPLGPYPATTVQFNITAWLPWSLSTNGQQGAIDRIYSPFYRFNWSTQGGWWYPTYGLLGNEVLTTLPDVTTGAPAITTLATGTPVNVTVHSPIQNVTISTASVTYRYSDANGVTSGTVPMGFVNQNTTYYELPGLPPSSTMTFSVTTKDVYGNPVSTGNFTYVENGGPATPLPGGYGLFFAEAIDLSTGSLVQNVNYTISNSTWSETGVGKSFGFLAPVPLGGVGYLPVAFGSYTVTLSAFGAIQTFTFSVSNSNPFTVVYYFASHPIPTSSTVDLPSNIAISAIVGLVAATLTAIPVVRWFRERRKKAEAEQRRITL
ncbi:MAG TPA: hypothetical protein VEY07_06855, partial [Thermoplasmata archaeon]|nr:hypothetical protein [Thermoplasmata archaeon]